MNSAEKIAAAIKRLEQLKADSTRGPWENMSDDWRQNWIMGRAATPTEGYYGTEDVLCINDDNLDGTYMSDGDIDLICTLHATIDAQLAILEEALGMMTGYRDSDEKAAETYRFELALADAILGEST